MNRKLPTSMLQAKTPEHHRGTRSVRQRYRRPALALAQRRLGNRGFGELIQARLQINKTGDSYEQEADRVADQVMRMTGPQPGALHGSPIGRRALAEQITPLAQREALEEDEEPMRDKPIQRQTEEDEEPIQAKAIQRQSGAGRSSQTTPHIEANINNMRGGGKPLPEPARNFFESRFGLDFGNVRLHTDTRAVETSRSIHARAFTVGSDIAFGAGQYAPETESGKSLLAHELTHVVQQRGSGANIINRYEVEGPFNINDPVHEVLTLLAIKDALKSIPEKERGTLLKGVDEKKLPERSSKKAHNLEPKKIHSSAQQFIRGVIWPDDPKGYLFDDDKSTTNYSSGIMWNEEFDPDEKDEPEELIARSHYGDLQFFHAMAAKEGEDPNVTKQKILDWSAFLANLSTGRIDPNLKVKSVPLAARLFPSHKDLTFKELFVYKDASDKEVRQRAAGALLHLIQDSHAAGHVERDSKTGAIKEFHAYEQQEHSKHGAKDSWAKGKTLGERIKNTPGAQDAIAKSAQVLILLDKGASTEEVIAYLDKEIFKLDPDAKVSGPGSEFKKETKGKD